MFRRRHIGRPSVATFIPSPWYPARNPDMFLSAGPKESGNVFALLWRVTPEQRFLIVLNVDTLLFDVFPSKWRDNAEAAITIGTEEAVARRNPTMLAGYQTKSFEARSDRYPLEVHLEIADSLFPTWRSYRAAPGALLGAAFGVMVFAISLLMINRRYGPALSLQRAIRHGEIQPFFQPVFKLSSREIIGCEVLVRWTKNGKVRHTPDSFIPQAEADGTIVALTDYLQAMRLESYPLC